MNTAVSGVKVERILESANLVLFFEGKLNAPNASGMQSAVRYESGSVALCFVDGHVAVRQRERMQDALWIPSLDRK